MFTATWNGSGTFLLVPIEEMSFFKPHVPNGVSIFGLQEVSRHTVFAVDQAFEPFTANTAPSSCLAMAALGEDGLALLAEARDLFTKWSGQQFTDPVQIDPSEAGQAIASVLLTRLLDRYRFVSKQCITYAGDLARLRSSHEELHNNFAALEAFIVSSNIQPINLVFSNLPVPGSVLSCTGLKEVTQVLPTSTFALSSIDIYVGPLKDGNRQYGGLEVDLTTLEENKIIARWHLDAEHIAEGWTNLDFAKTLRGHQRTVSLTIRTIGGVGDIPPLGLGQAQPLKAFRAQITPQGSSVPKASLALRCWSGLPGIAPPNISKSISFTDLHGASPVKRVAIPFTVLQAVEWVKTDRKPSVNPVAYRSEDRAITCNPPPKGITLAKLPEISLHEISRIEAHAFAEQEDAPVEFAVLFSDLPAKKIVTALLRGQAAKNQVHFSGWVQCGSGQTTYISSVVPDAKMTGSIFLATRLRSRCPRESVQAAFRDLQVTSLGIGDPEQPLVHKLKDGARIISPEPHRSRMLPVEDLRRVRVTNGKAALSQVRYDRATCKIKCELANGHDVIAVIPDVRVAWPIHLSLKASANRVNSGALSVGFGVSNVRVSEDTVLDELKRKTRAGTDDVAFTGWHEIGPAEDAVFELDIEEQSDGFVSLYLVARGDPSLGKSVAEFSNICVLEREHGNG